MIHIKKGKEPPELIRYKKEKLEAGIFWNSHILSG